MTKPRPESLQRHLDWLYGPHGVYEAKGRPCHCEHDWLSLGANMGKGWVRVTTHPDCVHHGSAASAKRDREQGRRRR